MITLILITLFALAATIESTAYAIYEIKVNQNKLGGITLIALSFVGLILPITLYLKF